MSSAVVAAAARLMQQHEEEENAAMNHESDAVEYKIIRSATGSFKNPAKFHAALEEEARAGWELVEKFDDTRVRLRRSIEWRKRDGELTQDPYRISVGMTESAIVGWVLLGIFLVIPLMIGAIIGIMKLVNG